jgi:hypothetical protein
MLRWDISVSDENNIRCQAIYEMPNFAKTVSSQHAVRRPLLEMAVWCWDAAYHLVGMRPIIVDKVCELLRIRRPADHKDSLPELFENSTLLQVAK